MLQLLVHSAGVITYLRSCTVAMQLKWQSVRVLSCATSLGNKKENLNSYPSVVHISVRLGPSAWDQSSSMVK
jgi:hypothetical protein